MNKRTARDWCLVHGVRLTTLGVDEFMAKLAAHVNGAVGAGDSAPEIPITLHRIKDTDRYVVVVLGELLSEGPDTETLLDLAYQLLNFGVREVLEDRVPAVVAADAPARTFVCRGCGRDYPIVDCSKKDTFMCPYYAMETDWNDNNGSVAEEES